MKLKYTSKPSYPEVDVIGKTVSSEKGTVDSKPIGRLFITGEEGFGPGTEKADKIILGGDENIKIISVKKADEIEVKIKLVDGQKSAASFKFYGAYTAKNPENDGVVDVYTTNGENIERAVACAERMADANPGCDGQYEFINAAGEGRVFLRLIVKELTATGKIAAA